MEITLKSEWLNPFYFFRKKEEEREVEMPDHLEIVFTEEAKEKGTLDDFNKEIKVFKNGFYIKDLTQKYSSSMLKAMVKTYGIVPLDLTTKQDEDYEFDEITALEGTIKKVVRI